jgi:hypothetical protein
LIFKESVKDAKEHLAEVATNKEFLMKMMLFHHSPEADGAMRALSILTEVSYCGTNLTSGSY